MSQTVTQDTDSVSNSTTSPNSYICSVRVTLDDALRELLCDIASGEYSQVMVVSQDPKIISRLLKMLPLFNETLAQGIYHPGRRQLEFSGGQITFFSPLEVNRFRGWHSDLQLHDLPRSWPNMVEVVDMLMMCNREHSCPKQIEVSDSQSKGDVNRI